MQLIKQSTTAQALVFFMYDSSNHVTGKTGLSPTVVIRKEGGSFASPSGAVTEIANGYYQVAGNATDTNALGSLVLSATASGADQATMGYQIVAFDPLAALATPTNITAGTITTVSAVTGLTASNLDATISSRSSATNLATANTALVKIQAATYDSATLSGSTLTLSNAATMVVSTTGRITT